MTIPTYSSIAELRLSTRARNALFEGGIDTVGDVLAALEEGDEALLGLKGFGAKSLADLKERLRERGFHLPGDPPPEVVTTAPQEKAPEEKPPQKAVTTTTSTALGLDPPPSGADHYQAVPSFGQRFQATLIQVREQISFGPWLYVLGALLVIAVLLLPPVALPKRLGLTGYTTLNAENSSISHPDGLTLGVNPETFADRLRVQLDAVSRLEFLEGSAGAALRQAVEKLPDHMAVKSPYYQIETRGDASQPMMIDVVIPNNAEPWETLDLYTWTGEAWEWVGSELHTEVAEHEFIRAWVTEVPASVVVVQRAKLITATVSTYLGENDSVSSINLFDELNPSGLLLGTMGGFAGEPVNLIPPDAGMDYAVLPTLRNWAPGATVNRGLLSDLLAEPDIQNAHVANIVQFCALRGFDGIDVDYRGVAPEERDAYTAFIRALADALHAEGLRLTVAVEEPAPADGGWDTGGYDWAAMGAAADALKISFPIDPTAYVEGGKAQRLLDWATAQVPRDKLRMLISSLSAEQGSQVNYLSLEQALAPFGQIVALGGLYRVEPNTQVEFGLSGTLLSIAPNQAAGTYRLEYRADDGGTHTVWLGTAANLLVKLRWADRYHLGGIAVADALAPGNAEGIVEAVTNYRATAAAPAGQEMEITWTVASAETVMERQVSALTEPSYAWMAPVETGVYTVSAAVAGFDHGSVAITVGEPEPEIVERVITETAPITPTEELTSTAGIGGGGALTSTAAMAASDEAFLDASYVADVTIPDDTQLDNDEVFEKTWRVRNSGTCAWPEDAVLAFSSGEQMGAPDSVEVGAVEPGDEVEISVEMKAPAEAGRYTGSWRMKRTEGFFGGPLTVVIRAGEVADAPSVVVAPISGGSFELGGHVRDTGLPYADKMHYAGMNWTKVQVHFGQDASGIIATSHAKGFKVQLSALGSAGMVTESGFEQEYANWVAGLAAAGADAIEIWNEPNIDREWQMGHISPQAYTNLLCASYSAIKAANPGTAVISGAPAPTGSFGGGCQPNGGNCDDAPWMAGLRDAGAVNCMDYIGAHHNSGATSPSARSGHPANPASTHHSWFFLPQTEMYYNTFGGARKLFYTEMGYASQEGVPGFSDAFGWARGTNNAQQAAWLAEAVQLSVNTGMVRCIIVWNIDFSRYGYDPQDGYAIIRPGGSCPACDTLHNVLGTR
jgi:hypothetical protein